jgi:branched-chain amino acid transport system ATP-binding protein
MLAIRDLNVHYENSQALHNLSMEVNRGEFVAIIGNNGAGKTTLLMTISGILKPSSGSIEFLGDRIDKLKSHNIIRRGIAQVAQGRMLFPEMTVQDNLELGALQATDKKTLSQRLEEVYCYFDVLAERKKQKAGTLSGGEQEMLTIARGLMASPKLLMLDEPSSGLAPIVVQNLAKIIVELNKEGLTILLVEQNAKLALEIANRAYVLESGRIFASGTGNDLSSSDEIRKAYLGLE